MTHFYSIKKKCSKCNIEKHGVDFYPGKSRCKECLKEDKKEYVKKYSGKNVLPAKFKY
ncbi:MAG: hypothetical protein AABY22_29450 [Nanoarchaeota archaeon]